MGSLDRKLNQIAADNLPNRGGDPDRPRVLGLNREMRKERLNNDLGQGLGYLAFNIPVPDMRVLLVRFPELGSQDHEIKTKAWKRFAQSPLSGPYKVRRGDGKRRPNNRILIR